MLGFFVGFLVALLSAGILGYTDDRKIKSGEPFIVDNATYQCVITNKLKGL